MEFIIIINNNNNNIMIAIKIDIANQECTPLYYS